MPIARLLNCGLLQLKEKANEIRRETPPFKPENARP
jgi:hypothetical protein